MMLALASILAKGSWGYLAEYNNNIRQRVDIRVSKEFSKVDAAKIAKQYADAIAGLPQARYEDQLDTSTSSMEATISAGKGVQLAVYEGKGNELAKAGTLSQTLASELGKLKLPQAAA